MQYRDSRQVVTGLTVNTKVNIRADYYASTRAMCSGLFATGYFYRANHDPVLQGPPDKNTSLAELEGVLNHIYFVRRSEASRKRKSDHEEISRKRKLEGKPEEAARRPITDRHGSDLLYERFLFYKNFVALEKPVILAEGKTDGIYLPAAIKNSPAYAGKLFEVAGKERRSLVRFFKYSAISHEIQNLGGSSSYFPAFIRRYGEMMLHYKHRPLRQPVIVLIDNDAGADGVFHAAKDVHVTVSHATAEPFYPLIHNLYLVKTPESAMGNHYSCVEDLFDAATLAKELEGKTFNKAKKIDPSKEYSKNVFAEKIVRPNAATIDFSKFEPLLNRIMAVIDDHRARVAAGKI
jgi:hypothetical protein